MVAVIKAKNMDFTSCANRCASDCAFQAEAFFTHLVR